jgi:hypothetical protein
MDMTRHTSIGYRALLRVAPFGPALAVACVFTLHSSSAHGQIDPRVGTWRLDLTRSTFDPGPPPKKQTLTYIAKGRDLAALLQGLDAVGRPIPPDMSNLVIIFDGKDHQTPTVNYDSSVWTRLSPTRYQVVRKKARAIVQTSTNVVSDDGRTMTITTTGVDATGRPIHNVRIYDKQ